MASTSSSAPILYSVLTTSHDNNEDFVNQLRNHLCLIENNVQETFARIQQRKPYTSLITSNNKIDSTIRNNFFDVLKDVANKNNLPFDENLFRREILHKQDSSPLLQVDIVRAKPSIINDTNDQHLSPVNDARRSQFAPVLSSTPVHQTSPSRPIPVDLTMATPSVAPVLTINKVDLSNVLPSAIVPQRAKVGRTAARPPRIPRGESVTRQGKNLSIFKEQEEETILAKEIHITTKRQIKGKQAIIEDNVQVIIEQQHEILPPVIKQVQTTPLRGKAKKMIQETTNNMVHVEPPSLPVTPVEEPEVPLKKTRGGRNKKKVEEEEEVKPTRTASIRNRNKKQEAEKTEEIPPPAKKTTRSRKLVEPAVITNENPSTIKVRSTPSRTRNKPSLPIPEPLIISSPKKVETKSRKRKANDDTNSNATDIIKPSSPKRRSGRNTKSKNVSHIETSVAIPVVEPEITQPISTRSSRRGKKDVEKPPEKQEEIVLNKPTRTTRGKKATEPINTAMPVTVLDVVMKSVTVSASVPVSSTKSLVAKPPRPPVARKKQSIALHPLPQTSPSTPPPTQRIQSTSPVSEKPLLPLPIPINGGRRRQPQRRIPDSPPPREKVNLDLSPSVNRNLKRTRSSVASTPKRPRHDDLIITSVPSTPGKKRKLCTCQKRRNKICDICAAAIDM